MTSRYEISNHDAVRQLFSINFRLNSARRDSSVNGPSSRLGESVRLADRTGIMSRHYTLQRAPVSTSIHIDYAAELNEQQLAAVTAPPGPLLVIAGAGSGKTRTLTYRVAYLLENGINPRNILLLTFKIGRASCREREYGLG